MRFIYFLPILSINVFAHADNSIHYHISEPLSLLLIGFVGVFFTRKIYRRFIWELKM